MGRKHKIVAAMELLFDVVKPFNDEVAVLSTPFNRSIKLEDVKNHAILTAKLVDALHNLEEALVEVLQSVMLAVAEPEPEKRKSTPLKPLSIWFGRWYSTAEDVTHDDLNSSLTEELVNDAIDDHLIPALREIRNWAAITKD
jgi:hypothetical protein